MCSARQARTACLILTTDAFHPAGGASASQPHPAVGTARGGRGEGGGDGGEDRRRSGGFAAPPAPSGRASNANTRTSARSGDGVAISPPAPPVDD